MQYSKYRGGILPIFVTILIIMALLFSGSDVMAASEDPGTVFAASSGDTAASEIAMGEAVDVATNAYAAPEKTEKTIVLARPVLKLKLRKYANITASWKKVSGADKYTVYYKKSGQSNWKKKTTKKTKLALKKLAQGKRYSFKVVATKKVDGRNIKSRASKIRKITTKSEKELLKKGIAAYIRTKKNVGKKTAGRFAEAFIKNGKKYGVDYAALMAIAFHESKYSEKAYNSAGYYGMMQTSATLGRQYGRSAASLLKAENSIYVATRYLDYNLDYFDGNYFLGLAGYMSGTGGAASGNYNSYAVNLRMDTRDEIKKFLKKNKYVL